MRLAQFSRPHKNLIDVSLFSKVCRLLSTGNARKCITFYRSLLETRVRSIASARFPDNIGVTWLMSLNKEKGGWVGGGGSLRVVLFRGGMLSNFIANFEN